MKSVTALLLLGFTAAALHADPVPIEEVVATSHDGTDEDLRECINGSDINRGGWIVTPRSDQPQAVVFRTGKPVDTAVDITLCFLSGLPLGYPMEFALSATSDPVPSLAGRWQKLVPTRWDATGPEVKLSSDGKLQVHGFAADAVFQLTMPRSPTPITGFRLEVFPTSLAGSERKHPKFSLRLYGDFTLTQFRVDALVPQSTNIALGRPVTSSSTTRFPVTNLTDGLPGTFSHPEVPARPGTFSFLIDLGSFQKLDHISFRNRGDGNAADRLSKVVIELYGKAPDSPGSRAAWRGQDRANGSHPAAAEVDVIRSRNGVGRFEGRWLKLSSASSIAFSPEFAEVEVYKQLTLELVSARVDGMKLPLSSRLEVPAGSRWLTMTMILASSGTPEKLPCRWRLRGYHTDWQPLDGLTVETACPPPGRYVFEAQVQHTDGQWNAWTLSVPVDVRMHLWQTPAFHGLLAVAAILGLAWFVRGVTRRRLARKMAALELNAALDEERARVARDMHDEVGARLSQLAILHDIFAREHALPDSAQAGMRQLAYTTRRIITSLDEVVWAVNPRNDTLASLASYLEQCASDYLGPVEIACRLDSPFEWPVTYVRAQVRHNLVLAFREALQNVVKHSGATEVTLRLRLEGKEFRIELTDNGGGLPENPAGPGKDGLINMGARLAAIGGVCEIRSRPEGGAVATLRVKLTDESGKES